MGNWPYMVGGALWLLGSHPRVSHSLRRKFPHKAGEPEFALRQAGHWAPGKQDRWS